ncbi:MAG: TetR family transcriptional regulator C-terminal domain-containing protein [Rhodoferax sp.]|uniref:TetR family transcriptional regulator C-terminal domain-containing protein n=1 Tax=Rhodoferax sp. TaxID=50421 RepID=UPI002618126E|nr:TetR family transcriptional regulator C-terminal domain-containing protein [Rhodoferax sp.]MDD5334777.1 TetR family transcriptional regulator C-terminal domain-containing protein [Rhodoferax sp.]
MIPLSTSKSAVAAEEASKGQIRQANEALILAAAERVFAGAGFGGATMAAIAEAAGLPKANLHYYFGSKQELYRTVLARILEDWLVPTHGITAAADPRTAIERYIRAKMALSAQRPHASKVFANELLHGAPVVKTLLATELREMVAAKVAVIDGWIRAGRMAPVDAVHLFFTIWAATQTYADFDVQVRAVLGRPELTAQDHARATEHVVSLILRGCGLLANPANR